MYDREALLKLSFVFNDLAAKPHRFANCDDLCSAEIQAHNAAFRMQRMDILTGVESSLAAAFHVARQ